MTFPIESSPRHLPSHCGKSGRKSAGRGRPRVAGEQNERSAGGGAAGQPVRGRRPMAAPHGAPMPCSVAADGGVGGLGGLDGLVGTRMHGNSNSNSTGFALAFGV